MTRVTFEGQQLLLFFHRRTGSENTTEEPLRYEAMAKLKRRTTHRVGDWGAHRPRGGFVSDGCPCAQGVFDSVALVMWLIRKNVTGNSPTIFDVSQPP